MAYFKEVSGRTRAGKKTRVGYGSRAIKSEAGRKICSVASSVEEQICFELAISTASFPFVAGRLRCGLIAVWAVLTFIGVARDVSVLTGPGPKCAMFQGPG